MGMLVAWNAEAFHAWIECFSHHRWAAVRFAGFATAIASNVT